MSSNAAIASAIRLKFRDEVAVPQSLNLVVNDNEPPPTSPAKRWYRLTFAFDPKEQLTFGPAGKRRYRQPGRATLEAFEVQGEGDGEMLELFDAVAAAFQNSEIASPQICFEPPPHPEGEPLDAGGGYVVRSGVIYFEAYTFE